jgi:uncharacterized protein YxjI
MRYVMKQQVFSFGDKFAIRNEAGAEAYFVDGDVFTIGKKLHFEDAQGNELLFIRQKLLSVGATYELFRGEEHVATIRKEPFTFFHCTFDIHIDGHGDLEARGDLTDYEYTVTRNGEPVAEISKAFLAWGDTYGVDIADSEDQVLLLAATVVIDMCCHESR